MRYPIQTSYTILNAEKRRILYCCADLKTTRIYLDGEEQILSKHKLLKFETELNCGRFVRIHKSYLVNLHHVHEFMPKKGIIRLSDCTELPVARRKHAELRRRLLSQHTVNSENITDNTDYATVNSKLEKRA